MKFAIYPPIGIARVGNSDEYFIGSERTDSLGVEIADDGSEVGITSFKDTSFRMKRQAARFHIFEIPDSSDPKPAELPEGTTVEWKVNIANKKDAVNRPGSPPDEPHPVVINPTRQDRVIQADDSISGAAQGPVSLNGTYINEEVNIGSLYTDDKQRLIFVGGSGRSETLSNPPASIGGSFYNNPDWFDDVADGSVSAKIQFPDGTEITADPSWIIVAPPDFSPVSKGVVTMYDLILDVAIAEGMIPEIDTIYFDTHIRPILERASSLQYVNGNALWTKISTDWASLGSTDDSHSQLRKENHQLIMEAENALADFYITEWQLDALEKWSEGDFELGAEPNRGLCDELTLAALDPTLGQGLFPGIEAGRNITEPSIYLQPFEFRLDNSKIEAGDLTALMALPWQADFHKCSGGWWPAQRPDLAPQTSGADKPWLRPWMEHLSLVENVMRLGVINYDENGYPVEQGRDPGLGS